LRIGRGIKLTKLLTKVGANQKCYHVTHGEGKYADEQLKDIGLSVNLKGNQDFGVQGSF
jgi:hypothetical protein